MARAKAKPATWRSRIVGHDSVAPSELVANEANWRTHPPAQREALAQMLGEIGWVQDVIVNRRTGRLVDGHLRLELALERGETALPVVYVDISAEEERRVLLTLDPLAAMAGANDELLRALVADAQLGGAAADLFASLLRVHDEYTQKIVTPIYEPSGPPPAIADLFDDATTEALAEEILAADLPEDVRRFLLAAAQRHTAFRFDRIANYYAHAPAAIQRLMEHSALVIVDAEQAIERGFLRLHETVLETFREDYPDA